MHYTQVYIEDLFLRGDFPIDGHSVPPETMPISEAAVFHKPELTVLCFSDVKTASEQDSLMIPEAVKKGLTLCIRKS